MQSSSHPRLIGDIGGTNARFAWQMHPGAVPVDVATYACAQHASLLAAIRHYLTAHGRDTPRECALGIANPILGDHVQMTNHHWSFSISGLQHDLQLQRLKVINDFTALALSLPALQAADLRVVGGGHAVAGAPMAVIGPGTGLGVSGLLAGAGDAWIPINGEGGHVTLPATGDFETAVVEQLHRRFGHASAERALSGPGLVNLYQGACAVTGQVADALEPWDVLERARLGSDAGCTHAIALFCALLGSVAGNLALTLGARGGVYIGGGIAPRLLEELRASEFRERFESKGRFRSYLADIPTRIIDAAMSPALLGAARALDTAD